MRHLATADEGSTVTAESAMREAHTQREGRLRRTVRLGIALYAWGLVLALGLRAATGDRLPPVTAFSQLVHVLTLAAPILLPLAWRMGSKRTSLPLAVGTAALLWFWGPWFFSSTPAHDLGSRSSLTVMTWNLGYGVADTDEVIETIRRVDPDFAALQEVQPWQAELLYEELGRDYPFHGRFEDGLYSKGYLSRIEPESVEMIHPEGAPSYMIASIPFDDEPITITCVHASTKLSYSGRYWWGHDQLVSLAAQTAEVAGILVGDLNTTERSETYRRIAEAGLKDAFRETGSGPGFTFPVFRRFRGIPVPPIARIDYLWYGAGLACHRAEVTAAARSDHHGVVAVFSRQ